MGLLAGKILKNRFELSLSNIKKAFPQKSSQEIRKIAVKSWENMGMVAGEVIKSVYLSRNKILEKIKVENTGEIQKQLTSNKGALLHLGHIANWEITGAILPLFLGPKSGAIARHIRNPFLDKWITRIRSRFGMEVISHRNPFFPCAKKLKKGWAIGILMDQNMPANAIFAPFLGRYCAITPITALLSLKTQTPIFPVSVTRDQDGILHAVFEKSVIPDTNYSEDNVYKLVEKLNQKLEHWIKTSPHLWLWAHNRWKREYEAKK